MMKQDSNPPTVCGQCGVDDRKFLHNVRHRTTFRRLCTTCVLRLHPQCFCPSCLAVYDRSPPINAVICHKCYSSSHPTCVTPPIIGTINSSRGLSLCSSCVNPNLLVFNLNRLDNRNGGRKIDRIDGNAARLLLTAAKIAVMSLSKAEVSAAMEAERRAKEAAYTKKRAREAVDHVVSLMVKEKNNKKVCNVNSTVKRNVDDSSDVLDGLNAVESGVVDAQGSVVMEVDVVGCCKDSGVGSVCENGQEH